jgi:hypothetical protein
MTSDKGERLIFLVSQPRSGSTLLQRILGGNPEIDTCSETWLLLRPLWGISTGTVPGTTPYNAVNAQLALDDYLANLPGGVADYYSGCALMYSYLYDRALQKSGRRLYLDKTPRYYSIFREIAAVFPAARFLILARHPLAVMESILRIFAKNDWARLYEFRDDLLIAPRAMLDARDCLGERAFYVNYESLIANPPEVVGRICGFLGVSFDEAMVSGYMENFPEWRWGDPVTIHERKGISGDSLERWKEMLVDPQFRVAVAGYLDALGDDLVAALGYDPRVARAELEARTIRSPTRMFCVGWNTLLCKESDGVEPSKMAERRYRWMCGLARLRKRFYTAMTQRCRAVLKGLHVP